MRHLGRAFRLRDSPVRSEDASACLVKHGRELLARGGFFTAFPTIMLPRKYLCWKPAKIPPAILLDRAEISVVCAAGPESWFVLCWDICTLAHVVK